MDISLDTLRKILDEAYDLGFGGCRDLKKQDLDDLLVKYKMFEVYSYRVWSVKELREMPAGTLFNHLNYGRCWIVQRSNGDKFIKFAKASPSGMSVELHSDAEPWDRPMRIIHE